MNILLSTGYLPKAQFANINIAYNLANELEKLGHKCYIIGISNDDFKITKTSNGIPVYKMHTNNLYNIAMEKLKLFIDSNNVKKNLRLKFLIKHPVHSFNLFYYLKKFNSKNETGCYKTILEHFILDKKIDAIIGFCYPFNLANVLKELNVNVKKIYHQFDPHGLHLQLDISKKDQRIKEEVSLIENTTKTITTQILYKNYINHPNYSHLKDKLISADFPTFIKKEDISAEPAFVFDENYINLLFCGTLDDDFRNPEQMLKILKPILVNNSKIRIYFLGNTNNCKILKKIDSDISNQIFIKSTVPNTVANSTIMASDILINIGSTIPNMLASKIFDYFSTCKPILNIQTIENCSAEEYFNKYPNQFTLKTYEKFTKQDKLLSFILNSQNVKLNYEDIEKIYYTATPKYVAKQIEDIIK